MILNMLIGLVVPFLILIVLESIGELIDEFFNKDKDK